MNKIQTQLLNIKSSDIFVLAIHTSVKTDLPGILKLIREQAADNRPMMVRIIGNDLLTKIENLKPPTMKTLKINLPTVVLIAVFTLVAVFSFMSKSVFHI